MVSMRSLVLIRRSRLMGVLCWMLAFTGCSKSDHATSGGSGGCDAGYVNVQNSCHKVCDTDSECAAGAICNSIEDAFVCVAGDRTDAPRIDGIDGDGSVNGAEGELAHHLDHALVVTGDHFEGADVYLVSPRHELTDITVVTRAAQRIEVALPASLAEEAGLYRLQIHGDAGNAEATFKILRGEAGVSGFPGAAHLSHAALFASASVGDSTSHAISVTNTQVSDTQLFPAGGEVGVLLTAISRSNHALLTTPPAGTWYTSADGLTSALNALDVDAFVLLASRGDMTSWLRNGGAPTDLANTLKQFGAMPGAHRILSNEAFVMVGRKGLSEGNGVFMVGTDTVNASVSLVDGDVVGASTANYGVCVKGQAGCTLDAEQLPNGLGSLVVESVDGGVTLAHDQVTTAGSFVAGGSIATVDGSIGSTNGNVATTNGNVVTTNGNLVSTNGSISATNGTVSGASAAFTGNVNLGGGGWSASTCTMTPVAGTLSEGSTLVGAPMVWNNTSVASSPNNHCYSAFTTTTPITWYAAQMACNSMGAHLVTITSANEMTFANSLGLADATEYWIGLSDYEELGGSFANNNAPANDMFRFVGSEFDDTPNSSGLVAIGYSTITGTTSGADCAALTKGSSAATTAIHTCNSTAVSNYICERRLTPFVQPCAAGFWSVNGGRLCVQSTMNSAAFHYTAIPYCQNTFDAPAHICSNSEMMTACGAGYLVFSEYASNVLTSVDALGDAGSGWFSDRGANDDYFVTWNRGYCTANHDAAQLRQDNLLRYRCCY